MKPMIFSADRAFEQLDEVGKVATFRKEEKDTEEVWVRRSRTGPKEFDAEIVRVERLNPARIADVRPHAGISGFESAEDWVEKIRDVHGDLSPGYVHIVEKSGAFNRTPTEDGDTN